MDDFFGAPTGKLENPMPEGLTNGFATIPDRSIDDMVQSDRVLPRQMTSGVMRGTQRITNTDGSYLTLGVIPNTTEFGIAFYNAASTLIRKITMLTDFSYDAVTGKNIMQFNKLPDGSYGVGIAKTGFNVSDGITP